MDRVHEDKRFNSNASFRRYDSPHKLNPEYTGFKIDKRDKKMLYLLEEKSLFEEKFCPLKLQFL